MCNISHNLNHINTQAYLERERQREREKQRERERERDLSQSIELIPNRNDSLSYGIVPFTLTENVIVLICSLQNRTPIPAFLLLSGQ